MSPIDRTEDVFKKLGIDPSRRPPPEAMSDDPDPPGTDLGAARPGDRGAGPPLKRRPPRPPGAMPPGADLAPGVGLGTSHEAGPATGPARKPATSLSEQWKARVEHRDRPVKESSTRAILLLVTLWSATAAALAWDARPQEVVTPTTEQASDAARAAVYLAALGAQQSAADEGGFPHGVEGTWMEGVVEYTRVPIGFEITAADLAFRNGDHIGPFRDALDRLLDPASQR